jgi:putative lipoic acid-binding regulatory protein
MTKKLITFPCLFPIKVMGTASDAFEGAVVSIVNQHVSDLGEGAIVPKLSKNGNYISLTVTINAKSQKQLDALYQALTDEPSILMVL